MGLVGERDGKMKALWFILLATGCSGGAGLDFATVSRNQDAGASGYTHCDQGLEVAQRCMVELEKCVGVLAEVAGMLALDGGTP